MALDPLSREVVRHGDRRRSRRERHRSRRRRTTSRTWSRSACPGACADVVPDALGGQLGRFLHAVPVLLGRQEEGEHTTPRTPRSRLNSLDAWPKNSICRDFPRLHTSSSQLWTTCSRRPPGDGYAMSSRFRTSAILVTLWITDDPDDSSILPAPPRPWCGQRLSEGPLPAVKRTYQPNVRRRKRKHGFRARMSTRGGPRDPQAPPRQGPQAPLRLSAAAVERRHRLSRSRDFDAVYRQGRSVSTRYLRCTGSRGRTTRTPRRDSVSRSRAPSVGAVARNRVKRQLREVWSGARSGRAGRQDYVLAARPGLAEAAESRGHDWLVEQVREVIGKARA